MALYVFECEPAEREYWQGEFSEHEVFCAHTPLTTIEEARDAAVDAEAVAVFVHSHITDDMMAAMPNLKLIATRSTGFNHIDCEAAARRGIAVCNVPTYGENTVAEHAFALLLAISRKVLKAVAKTNQGDFSTDGLTGFDLKGKTLGVMGTGRIGKHTLKIAKGFDMNLIACDRHEDPQLVADLGVRYMSPEELVRQADIISLHLVLSDETRHILGPDLLPQCKPGMVLINTARGELVDNDTLIELLQSGQVVAAGLDVVEGEDFMGEGEVTPTLRTLIEMPNVLLTPHMAFDSKEALERIRNTSVETIHKFYSGEVQNQVKAV